MATNYNVYEAVKILADRNDFEKVNEIHRRFPYLSDFAIRVIAKAPEEFMAFMEFIPEHITANKVNGNMKKKFEGATLEEAAEENVAKAEEKPAKKEKKEEVESDDVTYDKLPAKRLREIVEERGLADACVEKFGKINRSNMLAILEAADKGELEAEILEGVEDEAEEAGKYDGIPAPKLFKMCKERGLKPEPKKPAKHYVELLEAADAEAEKEAVDDDDDWDDEESAEVESKEVASEDDDDEDWDI